MAATNPAIEEQVNRIFVDLFEVSSADLSADKRLFEDLGLDSLDAIDMAIRFQKEFKMKPSNAEMQSLRTVGDIYALVGRYAARSREATLG